MGESSALWMGCRHEQYVGDVRVAEANGAAAAHDFGVVARKGDGLLAVVAAGLVNHGEGRGVVACERRHNVRELPDHHFVAVAKLCRLAPLAVWRHGCASAWSFADVAFDLCPAFRKSKTWNEQGHRDESEC